MIPCRSPLLSSGSSLPGECPKAKPHRPKVHRGIFEYHTAVSFSSRPLLGVLVSSVRRSCRRVPVLARRCTGLPLTLCLARSLLCCSSGSCLHCISSLFSCEYPFRSLLSI